MLVTLRHPITDLRGFAADDVLAENLRLPRVWATENEFVRGVGRLQPRRKAALPEWPSERMFADFAGMVRFDPCAIEQLNKVSPERARFLSLRRRMWQALPESNAQFDFDVLCPVHHSADWSRRRRYSWQRRRRRARELSAERLVSMALEVGRLLVHVRDGRGRPWDERSRTQLALAGDLMAQRFEHHTSRSRVHEASRFVSHGPPTLVLEATGIKPITDVGRVTRYSHRDVEILTVTRRWENIGLLAGRPLTIHVITSRECSKEAASRVREMRIHLLRLKSLRSLLEKIVKSTWGFATDEPQLATKPSPAYDRLQFTLAAALEVLRKARVGGVETSGLLSAAFLADSVISNHAFEALERRLLASARPALIRGLREFAELEHDRAISDALLKAARDQSGVVHIHGGTQYMSKYDMRGANIGAAGDGASANTVNQANAFAVGASSVDRFDLVHEINDVLRSLDIYETAPRDVPRFLIEDSDVKQAEIDEARSILKEAEIATRADEPERARLALRRGKRWLVRFSEAVGAAVVAAVIKHEAGL